MKQPTSKDKNSQYFRTDHLKDDLKGRSVRGGVTTMVSQGCKFALSLGSNILLARLLTPYDYGLVGMVTTVTGFITLFKDLGLSEATIQKEDITHEQVSVLFWVNIALSLATALVTVAIAPLLASFYREPRLIWVTLALASGFIINGLSVQHFALLRRQMRFDALVTIDVLSNAAGIGTAIVTALYGAGYWALIWFPLVTSVVNCGAVWMVCGWRPGFPLRHVGVRSMLMFGGNLTGFNVVNYFARNLDNVLIGRFWGTQQLGLYTKAYQLLLLPLQQINGPFAAVAVPALSRLVDSPDRYRQAYLRVLEKLTIITSPLVVFMIATSDWLVVFLLGAQWKDASALFSLLGIVALTQPVANTTGWIFITQGRTKDMFQWGIVGSTLSVISIVAGLPWGATGVAASYSISGLLIRTPLLFWYVGRGGAVKTGDFYRTMAPSTIASLCAMGAILALRYFVVISNPLLGLVIGSAITASVTLLVLSAMPTGRAALQDFKELMLLLIKNKGKKPQL